MDAMVLPSLEFFMGMFFSFAVDCLGRFKLGIMPSFDLQNLLIVL